MHIRTSSSLRLFAIVVICLFAISLQAAPVLDENFNDTKWESKQEKVSAVKKAGWKLNDAAAKDTACFIKKIDKWRGYVLHLIDNDNKTNPTAEKSFKKTAKGTLTVELGTDQEQNQAAKLMLMSGEKVLGKLVLENNQTGTVHHAGGKQSFKSEKKWYRNPQTFTITWSCSSPDSAGTFDVKMGDKVICSAVAFTAAGYPDGIRLAVGWGSAVKKGLILRKATIIEK